MSFEDQSSEREDIRPSDIAQEGLSNAGKYQELEARYLEAVREQAAQLQQEGEMQLSVIKNNPFLLGIIRRIVAIGHKVLQPLEKLSRRPRKAIWRQRRLIVLCGSTTLLTGLVLLTAFMLFMPQSINYGFAKVKNCVVSPTIFPSLFKVENQSTFVLSREPSISIGHTAIFSYHLCATPKHNPIASTNYVSHQRLSLGVVSIDKVIKVVTANYLAVSSNNLGSKAIAIEKPLSFKLSAPDATFDYAIAVNQRISPCSKENITLSCNLAPLKLSYAASYKASLVRVFNGQMASTVLSKTLQTITATAITQTSIGSGSVVYDKPQQIIVNTNKTVSSLQTVSLTSTVGTTTTDIPITSSFSGQTITINLASPLPRQASLDLHIKNLTASDDSTLEQPYDLTFTTSGGPKVTDTNIPAFGLASGQAMTLTFDQPLNPNQSPSQFVSLLVNDVEQPAYISMSGQQITIEPTGSYPVCATVTVQVASTIESNYGVSGGSSWSYTSRSHCYTTFSIGTSAQGRPITAYKFGSGPSMVLYIAAMEGNEQNSANLLQQWIPDVDANPGKIPSYRTLVIIPQINPDGYAANTRLNADGIDLNRNFPSDNWQEQVTEPTAPTVWTNDGGPNPLSEPESQALANYYEANHPRLTLTMHSHGGIVEPNDAADSIAIGAKYASLADYDEIPTYAIGNFFDYTTTGAFEDWANDRLGLPVLEVELESATSDEYTRNLPGLWAMAQVSQ